MDTVNIFWSLAAGISCTSKEAKYQIQHKQLDYIKEKDTKKKNKAEKWHPTSRRLVLNVASSNNDLPANKIPPSYLCIINSATARMSNKKLQSQMSELGCADANFAHGLAAGLYIEGGREGDWTGRGGFNMQITTRRSYNSYQ